MKSRTRPGRYEYRGILLLLLLFLLILFLIFIFILILLFCVRPHAVPLPDSVFLRREG